MKSTMRNRQKWKDFYFLAFMATILGLIAVTKQDIGALAIFAIASIAAFAEAFRIADERR